MRSVQQYKIIHPLCGCVPLHLLQCLKSFQTFVIPSFNFVVLDQMIFWKDLVINLLQ